MRRTAVDVAGTANGQKRALSWLWSSFALQRVLRFKMRDESTPKLLHIGLNKAP
jgi:hypothetical protein